MLAALSDPPHLFISISCFDPTATQPHQDPEQSNIIDPIFFSSITIQADVSMAGG
jgi:hypothetical protein